MKMVNSTKNKNKIMYYLIYVFAFTCFFQSQFLKVSFGELSISINKIIILVFCLDSIFRMLKNGKISFVNGYYYKFLVLWIAWQGVNIAFGILNGFEGWINLTYRILIFVACGFVLQGYIKNIEDLYKIFFCFQIGMMLQVGIGIFEHITGIYLWTGYKELFTTVPFFVKKRYPCGMQNNPNDFATLMFFTIFISLILFNVYKKILPKMICGVIIGLSFYLIVISDARAILLGVILGLVSLCILDMTTNKKNTKGAIIWRLIVVIVIFIFLLKSANEIIQLFDEKLKFDIEAGSEQTRLEYINQGIKKVIVTFGIGIGSHFEAWHNFFIEILVESGIVVFVSLIKCFGLFLKDLKKIRKGSVAQRDKTVAMILTSMLIGYIIVSVAPASTLNIEWMGIMFGSVALFCFIGKHVN